MTLAGTFVCKRACLTFSDFNFFIKFSFLMSCCAVTPVFFINFSTFALLMFCLMIAKFLFSASFFSTVARFSSFCLRATARLLLILSSGYFTGVFKKLDNSFALFAAVLDCFHLQC